MHQMPWAGGPGAKQGIRCKDRPTPASLDSCGRPLSLGPVAHSMLFLPYILGVWVFSKRHPKRSMWGLAKASVLLLHLQPTQTLSEFATGGGRGASTLHLHAGGHSCRPASQGTLARRAATESRLIPAGTSLAGMTVQSSTEQSNGRGEGSQGHSNKAIPVGLAGSGSSRHHRMD